MTADDAQRRTGHPRGPAHHHRPRGHRRARPARGDRLLRAAFGVHSVHEEVNEEQGVHEAMLAVGDGETRIQLLAPLSDDSTIAKFIGRNGPGLQQLAFRVDDVEAVSATLRERGLRLLYDEPQAGHVGQPGQLRAPQGRRRRARRAGRARAALKTRTRGTCYPSVTSASPRTRTARTPSRRSPGRQRCTRSRTPSSPTTSAPWPGLPVPESYRGVVVRKDEQDMFEGLPDQGQGPPQVAARRRGGDAGARPGRGDRRRHGVVGELQHRLDVDLRAGLDLRLPGALRPALRAHQAARPALPRGRLRPVRRRAARSARA